MGKDATDNPVEQPSPPMGLTPDRAANISTENQGQLVAKAPRADEMPLVPGFDGLQIPPLKYQVNGGDNQINDCKTDKCVVNGKQYKDSTEIPGNQPKPLLHPDGKPVLGPDGQAVYGPERIDLDKIAMDAKAHQNMLTLPKALLNFRHSGDWDFQRMAADDGRPIFTQKYQNFSNIGIGYIMGALGLTFEQMSGYADTYCKFRCSYNEPMSKEYPYLAERQVKDFQIGIDLYKERHPEVKKQ